MKSNDLDRATNFLIRLLLFLLTLLGCLRLALHDAAGVWDLVLSTLG